MKKYLTLIVLSVLLFGCQNQVGKNNQSDQATYTKKNYYENGKLMSEIPVVDDIIHGIAKNYYKSGKLHSDIYYNQGEKTKTVWFYETGEVYRVTPFKNNKIHGIRKFYHRNNNLMAEVPYENGEPVEGLKEYTTSGTLVTGYPTIQFKKMDKLDENMVSLRVNLSNFSPNVTFYQYIENNGKTIKHAIPADQGVAQLNFTLRPGFRIDNKKITIYAETNSGRGHPYITHADYYMNAINPK